MICILRYVMFVRVKDNEHFYYRADASGNAKGEPVNYEGPLTPYPGGEPDAKYYLCTNCCRIWDSFDAVREHLGKSHD